MTELKPCPFCGGGARIRKMSEGWKHGHIIDSFTVECTECGANLPPFESDIWIGNSGSVHIDTNGYEDAIEAWNRRASDVNSD